ncbi:hypothetical protein [uncultured Aliiroseovarius sp.]|uniref:hypothetical protein n=1 Tax=uncultured Aliiroseovarius sp. TaxID=1658783 RepID=UPI002596C1C5|nr:hypothetical protein [uncultured Aliiroseovarius sp.]
MRKLLFLLFIFPLSACFDADLDFVVHDDENATMIANMKMGADFYGMIAATGEDPCEDGVGTQNDDGSFNCLVEETDTIDSLIAEMEEEGQDAEESSGVNPNQGVTIERLEGPFIKLTFDLVEMKETASDTGIEPSMMAMMLQEMKGHRIRMTITGEEIVETNGQLSNDGKTAEITIPLTAMLQSNDSLPDEFVTIVRTE